MESLALTSTTSSINSPSTGHTNSEEVFTPKNHYGSVVGGRTRQRVNSSSRPATPPLRVAANQALISAPNKLPFHQKVFVRAPQRPNTPGTDQSDAPSHTEPPLIRDERGRWDVENAEENQKVWKMFVYLSSTPVPSPPSKVSAASHYVDAQIALSQFTSLEKLRAILIGSNKKAVGMGEMGWSPVSPIEELIPTSGLSYHGGLDNGPIQGGMTPQFVRIIAGLHKEFNLTAGLMESFIFPVRLIDPFNLAICIINRSPFLRYLLARWRDLVWTTGLGRSLAGTRCNFTSSRAAANPELLFLEWYMASSEPLIRYMLNVFLSKGSSEYKRLMVDFCGNALVVIQDESMGAAITREIEIMATVRRELAVAIDTLFRQRVEMLRSPFSSEKASEEKEGGEDTLARKARKRDSRCLRVKLGKRARATLPPTVNVDDMDEENDFE